MPMPATRRPSSPSRRRTSASVSSSAATVVSVRSSCVVNGVGTAEELPDLLRECLSADGVHLIDCPIDYGDNDRILNREIKELSAAL